LEDAVITAARPYGYVTMVSKINACFLGSEARQDAIFP